MQVTNPILAPVALSLALVGLTVNALRAVF